LRSIVGSICLDLKLLPDEATALSRMSQQTTLTDLSKWRWNAGHASPDAKSRRDLDSPSEGKALDMLREFLAA
jgi:hypothetical protein